MLDGLHEEMVSAQKVVSELREAQEGKSLLVIPVKLCILYFFDQTPWLLFILWYVWCYYYSRALSIRGWHLFHSEFPNGAATI